MSDQGRIAEIKKRWWHVYELDGTDEKHQMMKDLRECLAYITSQESKIKKLKEEIEVSDKIITERNRILDEHPCPVHGPCVTHVLEKLQKLEAVRAAAKENLFWEDEIGRRGKLDITEWNSKHFAYQKLLEALAACEPPTDDFKPTETEEK